MLYYDIFNSMPHLGESKRTMKYIYMKYRTTHYIAVIAMVAAGYKNIIPLTITHGDML